MAAEVVGGALLSAFLQVAFDRLTSPQLVDFFRGRKLDDKLLANLNIMLHSINALADDAELKQFRDPHVKAWLFAVKEAVFDAQDLLGEIDYELIRCQVEAQSQPQTITYKVSNFFNTTFSSFNKKIESELKEVLDKLEYLARQKGALGLKESTYSSVGSGSNVSHKLPSTSLVAESVIYGRDADKEMIIDWLTSETEIRNQPSILSIVGMGGLGKTTLVQHVYNEPKIEDAKFDSKAWVCISDHFDVLTVTKTILEAITRQKDDSENLEVVHNKLKEKLSGKKFLLVLDDVWNQRRDKWEAVQTPLSYGAPGSRILVTTRDEKVASIMQSKVHRLKQLREDECWKAFEKHASKDDNLELKDELKEIGRRIVEKCKGLPLALKTIGCLLRTKSSISDWQSILESDIWDLPKEDSEIIPALFLSYHYLPSRLKRCFAYCALFPKDYEFVKEKLISLWMAENFLVCSQQIRHPEEVGKDYFNDLLSRSFFQQSNIEWHESSVTRHFVMHDLLNDLAKYVCGDFCFRLKFDKGQCIPKTTRHFSFVVNDVKCFDGSGTLTDVKRLRSFFPITRIGRTYCSSYSWQFKILIHDLFSKLKFLRVLSFSACVDLKEVPDSVGDLKHLHSLDLSGTMIQKLPDSICLLYNLLTLKLNDCSSMEELPSNLHKLTKLRCLEFENTKVRKMPMHFEELKNLQVLSTFFMDRNSELSTKQLGGLNLHGRLSIQEVQNVVNPLDAIEANLKNKHLVELELKWKPDHIPDDPRKEKKVLENLQPSEDLEHSKIRSYCGIQFPSWVFDNSLSNLVFLSLDDCKYCLCLPPLGLLSSLKTLEIRGLNGIVSIGAEFYGSSSSSFVSLERLEFLKMKEWEEWECKTTSFPRLQHLSVNQCPKLKGLSMSMQILLPSLTELRIIECPEVEMFPDEGLPSNIKEVSLSSVKLIASLRETNTCLESLWIEKVDVECFSDEVLLPSSLTSLLIYDCRNLKKMEYNGLCHLSSLILYDCPNLQCLPEEGLPKSITSLLIVGCPLLKQRCQNPEGEDWAKIAHIQQLNIP